MVVRSRNPSAPRGRVTFVVIAVVAISLAPRRAPAQDGDPAPKRGAAVAAIVLEDDAIAWRKGAETVVVHHTRDPWRPLLWPACAPGGVPLLRRWPFEDTPDEERDHPHHRGLWLAHGDVNGVDFWSASERAGTGRIDATLVARDAASGTFRCRWRSADGRIIMEDLRRVTVREQAGAYVLDFDVTFAGGPDGVRFGDTKEGTFALRLAEALRVKGKRATGHLRSATGLRDGEVWGRRAAWIHAFGRLGDVDVGLTMIDHPGNPRYPTTWHARDYGLLAANPFGLHDFQAAPKGTGDLVIAPEGRVRFRWRCLFHRGVVADDVLAAAAAAFAADDAPPPSLR